MEINLSNYQAYFLDYCEGNLTSSQIAELKAFLKEHPNLINELQEFEAVTLEPEQNIFFQFKDNLKKPIIKDYSPITEHNFQEFFVYDIDGELLPQESIAVKAFLEINPHLIKEYEAFKQTILSPDTEKIEYPNKTNLKKTVFIANYKKTILFPLSIAASLLIIFSIVFIFVVKNIDTNAMLAANYDIRINTEEFLFERRIKINNNSIETIGHKTINSDSNTKNNEKLNLLPVKNVTYIENKNFYELAYISIPEKITDNQIVIVSSNDELVQTEPVKEQPLLNLAWSKIQSLFNKEKNNISVNRNVDFWDIANVGVVGFNKITENDFQLLKQHNQNGEIVCVKLVGENFAISKTFSNHK